MIDFKNAKKATEASYLTPGIYEMKIIDAKFENPEGKTMYVELTFDRVRDGAKMKQKFYISEKEATIGRLKYLHEDWTGKVIEKGFNSLAEVGAYFEKVFQSDACKKITRFVKVGGTEEADGKVYANLGFAGFIIPTEKNPEEMTFEVGDANWILNVKKNLNSKKVENTDDVMIPGSTSLTSSVSNDDDQDLPF